MQFPCSSLALWRLAACFVVLFGQARPLSAQVEGGPKPPFELLHLWTSPIEQPALEVLKQAILKAGLSWSEQRVTGNFYGVRRELAARMAINVNPSAVFWIGALDPKSGESHTVFRRIDQNHGAGALLSVTRPEILSEVSSPEGMDAIPLVIHLQNVTVRNAKVFEASGIAPPKSWAEFLEMAPRLKAAGVTPIAVSGQRWLIRFLYLSILADGIQPDEFKDFLVAALPRHRFLEIAKRSFFILRGLKPFANSDYASVGWDEVLHKVIVGEAAETITGDFSGPVLTGPEVVCAAPPGNNFVMWSFDVIAFPVGANRQVQDTAMQSLATRDVLARFGTAKGGIPVVSDIARSELAPCARNSLDRWLTQKKILLSSEKWLRSLNIISSLAQLVWTSEEVDLDKVASRLFVELSSGAE